MSGNHNITNQLAQSDVEPYMRVGIYARVSTKDQNCEIQLRDLLAYCLARQFIVWSRTTIDWNLAEREFPDIWVVCPIVCTSESVSVTRQQAAMGHRTTEAKIGVGL